MTVSPKQSGERVEGDVIQAVDGLRWVPDTEDVHVDAETTSAIWSSDRVRLAGVCVVEDGVAVEIKSASVRLSSGKRGRFYIRREQHEQLLKRSGFYLLAIYAPSSFDLLAMVLVPAGIVDDRLSAWIEVDDRATYAQPTWSRIVNPAIVPREGGGR